MRSTNCTKDGMLSCLEDSTRKLLYLAVVQRGQTNVSPLDGKGMRKGGLAEKRNRCSWFAGGPEQKTAERPLDKRGCWLLGRWRLEQIGHGLKAICRDDGTTLRRLVLLDTVQKSVNCEFKDRNRSDCINYSSSEIAAIAPTARVRREVS
ncbi:unnamed protein product [Nezara viridula]|uniref:Uncharacterized protein n=1 Tax=Nezara viridula TaxID=85310 RepID=A0A9P0MPX6_NEZVI|nr:unnamed protein product [Nezara viridula]